MVGGEVLTRNTWLRRKGGSRGAQKFAVNKLKPEQENIKQLWVNEGTILMAKIRLVVAQHVLKCTFQGLQN